MTLKVEQPFLRHHSRGDGAAWAPTSISGLVGWYDADEITGLNDGDAVGTWSDESGNSNDLVQATVSKKPTYKTGIQNSLPSVLFNQDPISCHSALTTNASLTVFAVIRFDTSAHATHHYCITAAHESTANIWVMTYLREHTPNEFRPATYTATAGTGVDLSAHGSDEIIDDTFYIITWRMYNGTSDWACRKNGSALTRTYSSGADQQVGYDEIPAQNFCLGGYRNGGTDTGGFEGYMSEVLVYDNYLSTSDVELVEDYLNTIWAVY